MSNTSQRQKIDVKTLVLMALFIALAYVVSTLSFPIFAATPYLKLDFGNVFILLIGFLLGPIQGAIVCIIKELISVINSSSGGVGELANVIMTLSYILFPCIVYRYKKGIKTVIVSLIVACCLGTAAALVVNRTIVFPLYMGGGAKAAFESAYWYVLAFNIVKTASISAISVILYKRLSIIFKKK